MIQLCGITLRAGNFHLHDFSLEVRDGEYYILLGPSGIGKTVVLETIAGFRRPSGGRVIIDGRDVTREHPEGRNIGYVPQDALLFPHLPVRENILFGARARNISGRDCAEYLKYLIEVLGISPILDNRTVTLSAGEKQRVSIARALIVHPRIVLMDEPLSSLDRPIKKRLISSLKKIHRETGTTFLHVTHDQDEAFIMGSVISLMFDGKIEQTGKRNRIYFFPKTVNVAAFTGMQNIFEGTVEGINEETRTVFIKHGRYLFAAVRPVFQSMPAQSSQVWFGIRAEEVMILRRGRTIKSGLRDNIVEGHLTDIQERSSAHTLFFQDRFNEMALEIELPNSIYRRLGLSTGGKVTISLKLESVWLTEADQEFSHTGQDSMFY